MPTDMPAARANATARLWDLPTLVPPDIADKPSPNPNPRLNRLTPPYRYYSIAPPPHRCQTTVDKYVQIQFVHHLRVLGFRFQVLPAGFIIHFPHSQSFYKKKWRRSVDRRRYTPASYSKGTASYKTMSSDEV